MTTQRFNRYRQSPAVLSRHVGEEVLLTLSSSNDFAALAGSSGVVWDLLDGPRTFPELIDRMSALYGRPAVQLRADVEGLLDELVDRGLVEEVIESDA